MFFYSTRNASSTVLKSLSYAFVRRPFMEFIRQFRFIDLGIANKKSDARANAVELLRKAKIAQGDYQIGRTMVFLKSQAMKALTQRQRECMALWDPLVTILEAMALKKLNEESVQAAIPGLRRFQANVRRYVILFTYRCCLLRFYRCVRLLAS